MEFPELGQHCSESSCKRLDFLPVKCDACGKIYCKDHFQYRHHGCTVGISKDVQVPVCPLCNCPVPSRRGDLPDVAVSSHIDRECQSDPAQAKRKAYVNRCSVKGCKQKELIPVNCRHCSLNHCLKHRYPDEHNCTGKGTSPSGAAAMARLQQKASSAAQSQRDSVANLQTEDEALAWALQQSLYEADLKERSSDQHTNRRRTSSRQRSDKSCFVS
uniref:AN1-type domain-containing protein n=1 Tax=Amblyomma cajennense TaxID=34607 RepID=A0A023FGY2_AMBCJ